MAYATRADIEAIFGRENVAKWSQLDNEQSVADEARVTSALAWAEGYINARFRRSRFVVPLSGGDTSIVETWCARLAAWWLYRGRGFRDTEVDDMLQEHRTQVDQEIISALNGVDEPDFTRSESRGGNAPWIAQ